jgi:hypothetical protein
MCVDGPMGYSSSAGPYSRQITSSASGRSAGVGELLPVVDDGDVEAEEVPQLRQCPADVARADDEQHRLRLYYLHVEARCPGKRPPREPRRGHVHGADGVVSEEGGRGRGNQLVEFRITEGADPVTVRRHGDAVSRAQVRAGPRLEHHRHENGLATLGRFGDAACQLQHIAPSLSHRAGRGRCASEGYHVPAEPARRCRPMGILAERDPEVAQIIADESAVRSKRWR